MEFVANVLLVFALLGLVGGFIGIVYPSVVKLKTRKEGLKIIAGTFVMLIIAIIMLPSDSGFTETNSVGDSQAVVSKASNDDSNIVTGFLSKIIVSDHPFTFRNKQAVSIMLGKSSNEFIDITIIKSNIKTGFHSLLDKNDIENYLNDKFTVSLHLDGKIYYDLPNFNKTNFIELKVLEYNEANKKAIFEISFELTHINKHKNLVGMSNLIFEIKDIDFDLLKKDQTVKEFEDSVKREIETKSDLTNEQKINTLTIFEKIINEVKGRKDEIQHVRATQPLGRGESGSIYLAKWNGRAQRWKKEIEEKYKDVLGAGLKAPFCSQGAFNVRVAIGELPLLGIKYVFRGNLVRFGEENLNRAISNAEKEMQVCKAAIQ